MSRLTKTVKELEGAGKPVRMEAVARALGVSRATLYRRFGNGARVQEVSGVRVSSRCSDAQLFAAVAAVVAERGLRGATVEAVAKQAAVAPVTLYRRFGDRQALMRAFVAARPAGTAGRVLAGASTADVRGVLVAFSQRALAELSATGAVTRALLGDPSAARELGADEGTPHRAVLLAYFTRCVAAGTLRGDPSGLAAIFLAALLGLSLVLRATGAEMLVDTFLQGALSGERRSRSA